MKHALSLLTIFFVMMINCLAIGSPDGWDYEYKVLAPNTRSEHVTGQLFYKGIILSYEFNHVVTPIGEFVCIDADNPNAGWIPACLDQNGKPTSFYFSKSDAEDALTGKIPAFRKTSVKALSAESSEASLEGTLEVPPNGVGVNWFYVVKHEAWVNPEKGNIVIKKWQLAYQALMAQEVELGVLLPGHMEKIKDVANAADAIVLGEFTSIGYAGASMGGTVLFENAEMDVARPYKGNSSDGWKFDYEVKDKPDSEYPPKMGPSYIIFIKNDASGKHHALKIILGTDQAVANIRDIVFK